MACKDVSEIAYVPTVIIARAPTGGGTPYENINLLGKQQKNCFLTTSVKAYQLSATKIKSVDKVVLNDVERKENTDYTVDLEKGLVTFKITVPAPPVTGKDNLTITFTKEYEGYADRIQKCTLAVGDGYGTNDRIFFTGNPEKRNTDWFSGLNDPSYVPDLNYAKVGSEETAIMGYHRLEFSSNDAPRVVPFNTKVKKYVTLQIVVENSAVNEGFEVYGIIKRYTVGNYVK